MKRVFFVRHGEGEHNVFFKRGDRQGAKILDPPLTELGKKQAVDIAHTEHPILKDVRVDLIVSSPLRRTVQTAALMFKNTLIEEHSDANEVKCAAPTKILLHPDIQETGDIECDTGRPFHEMWDEVASSLRPEMSLRKEMFSTELLEANPRWYIKEGDYAHNGKSIRERLCRFTKWLQGRPETTIVVVGHHNAFLAMLECSFMNCEVREYALGKVRNSDKDHIKGILESWSLIQPPLVGTSTEGLDKEEIEHIERHIPYAKQKFKAWGYQMPTKPFR
mmetsp:Transcript_15236/g.20021  ORF Transcript_15236/g.20021 Transcript_15236/m.20021 type:complete len:277 (-) Transcript_15236:162-992(-)